MERVTIFEVNERHGVSFGVAGGFGAGYGLEAVEGNGFGNGCGYWYECLDGYGYGYGDGLGDGNGRGCEVGYEDRNY